MAAEYDTSVDVASLLKLLGERPIAYHRIYAKVSGSVTSGLLLSQFMYWTPRSSDPSGWFYKTQSQITEETQMSRSETESARKRLRTLGLIEEKRKGNPARMYYRVDVDRLANLIAGIPHTGLQESSNQECDNSANSTRRDYTETTTEINDAIASTRSSNKVSTSKEKKESASPELRARWNEYWLQYVNARALSAPAANVERSRAFADLKRAFPDVESMDSISVESFTAATREYALRNKPEFITIARVIASMATIEKEAPAFALDTYVAAYAERLRRSDRMLVGAELEATTNTIRSLITRHPELEPKHIVWATTWGWRRDQKCPTSDRLGWTVEQWIKDGRPETRMGETRGQR